MNPIQMHDTSPTMSERRIDTIQKTLNQIRYTKKVFRLKRNIFMLMKNTASKNHMK